MTPNYTVDGARIAYREDGYNEFWGREPDLILHQTDEAVPHIDTYRFPKAENGVVGKCIVYLTGGMSDLPQPGTEEHDEDFQRIELSTYAPEIVMTDSGNTDFIGWCLGWMAHYAFEQNTYFLHGQTFDWGKPIASNSRMRGFYFARMPFVDESELCRQSGTARSFIHLVTLSKAELEFRLEHGTEKLLELLERNRIPPFFDLQRLCTINGEQGGAGNGASRRA